LLQTTINAAVFASLLSNSDIIRIAGFASGKVVPIQYVAASLFFI
jgi:hypothetical protein